MPLAGLEDLTGTKIYVSAGEPASLDQAGYEALSWSQVVGVVSFGEWGDTQNDISEGLLGEGRIFHLNGASDGGELTMSVQERSADPGAAIIRSNNGGNDPISFKKLYVSGDAEYATGILTSPKFREASQDSVRGFTCMARINTAVLEVAAP